MKPKSRCLRHRRCCGCRAGAGCYALDKHHPADGRTMRRRDLLALGVAALAARSLTSQPAVAQSKYPDRPIRLVVPFPPGGGYDAVGRPWAEKMKSVLGTVVVENQGGGGSSLGAAAVARARPDDYTILLGGSSTHITEAILKSRPLYDPLKDLEPISNVVVSAFALAIHPAVPARTLREFIDYAKANPGKLSYGHAGVGSLNHLTANCSNRWQEPTSCMCHIGGRDRRPRIPLADKWRW